MAQVRSTPGIGRVADPQRGRPSLRVIGTGPSAAPTAAEADALRTAGILRDQGVGSGDRVLLKAGNSPEFVAALLALVHLDTSIVLVDAEQTAEETHRVARFTGVRFALVEQHGPLPDGVRQLRVADLAPMQGTTPGNRESGERFSAERWRARADALVLWSSGTTGEPKAVVKSGSAFLRNLERTRRYLGYRADDVLLPVLPFSHQYGLSMIFLAWLAGASLVVVPHTRLDRALTAGALHGATVVDATPATYRSLISLGQRRPRLLSGLDRVRLWCTGGAPMDRELGRHFAEATGSPLLDGYGSTEAGNIAYATPGNPHGCGRVLDGVDVRIVGEDGRSLPPTEVGEVWVRTPDLMEGYLTEIGTVAPPTRTEHYRTGDLGYRDESGNLHVLGRKFAVHRLGHTLYPEVLERKAEACGRPVKIVSLEDARRGHELTFVVEDPAEEEPRLWRQRICALLPPYEQPNHVLVMNRFPVNHRGKTDVSALTEHVHRALARKNPGRAGTAPQTGTKERRNHCVPK
ncbi:class I adenylate-forming enzyme family protein [Streptomyces sp. NBC_01353]|uniref:class I adenylate-forming enzyme family protein n=1 Tax=Streptomyces sp. NBC_01353 TaxID=2903835 RepID=UPI002E365F06|nr:class I adenylate-forming enzyme family protein [Streptomyces sp. NBC_01353]